MSAPTANGLLLPDFQGDEKPNVHNWAVVDQFMTDTEAAQGELGDLSTQDADALVLKPAAEADPAANGDMVFELTSDTTLTIKVKGSDDVVRSAAITLAAP